MDRVAVGEPTSSVSRRLGVRGKGSSLEPEEPGNKCSGKFGLAMHRLKLEGMLDG